MTLRGTTSDSSFKEGGVFFFFFCWNGGISLDIYYSHFLYMSFWLREVDSELPTVCSLAIPGELAGLGVGEGEGRMIEGRGRPLNP